MPKDQWLEHYASEFDTVEINNTFYHLPAARTFDSWHRTAPEGFSNAPSGKIPSFASANGTAACWIGSWPTAGWWE